MRNALKIIVLSGVLTVVCLEKAKGGDISSSSIYAQPITAPSMIPHEGDPGLLQMRSSDLPRMTSVDRNGTSASTPTVEAIPTPTAFHAGGFLLAMILLIRGFRKLRWA